MKTAEWLIGIIFSIIGAVILFFGIKIAISNYEFMETALTTTGMITDIETDIDSEGDTTHTVYVEYTVNGQKYESRSSFYSSGMRVGKDIEIYYAPNNPTDFMIEGENTFTSWFFPIFGLIFLAAGLAFVISNLNKASIKKYVLNNGELVRAEITEVFLNTSYAINGRHPYIIMCNWKNPSTGMLYEFKSENLWFNPEYILGDRQEIDVYVDMTKPKRYYVDVRELESLKAN